MIGDDEEESFDRREKSEGERGRREEDENEGSDADGCRQEEEVPVMTSSVTKRYPSGGCADEATWLAELLDFQCQAYRSRDQSYRKVEREISREIDR